MKYVVLFEETLARERVLDVLWQRTALYCSAYGKAREVCQVAGSVGADLAIVGPYASPRNMQLGAVAYLRRELPHIHIIAVAPFVVCLNTVEITLLDLKQAGANIVVDANPSSESLVAAVEAVIGPSIMRTRAPLEHRGKLLEKLDRGFSLDEMKVLAFELGLNYEHYRHDTNLNLAMGLITDCERRGRLGDLLERVQMHRPLLMSD